MDFGARGSALAAKHEAADVALHNQQKNTWKRLLDVNGRRSDANPYDAARTSQCLGSKPMGINMCLDMASAPLVDARAISKSLGAHGDMIKLVNSVVEPVLSALLKATGQTYNLCMGTFDGETLAEPEGKPRALRLGDLRSDGCYMMPLNKERKYTTISFGVPVAVLDSLGLCSVGDPDEAQRLVSICLAYSCEGGVSSPPPSAHLLDPERNPPCRPSPS